MPARLSAHASPSIFAALAVLLVTASAELAPLAAEETPAAPVAAAETTPAPPATPPATPPAAPATPPATTTPTTTPAVPATRPRISAAETTHDAGKVRKGKRVDVDFALQNQGDAPLAIKDAQPACGCTVASFDKLIAPGATGKVRARLDTANFTGPIAKHITVLSNDPDTPRLLLTIKVDVVALVRVQPSYVRILHVQSEESPPVAVTLWSTDDKPLDLGEVESPAPWIAVKTRRATAEERLPDVTAEQWRLEVALAPDAPIGPLSDSIKVRTGHPEEPEIEIPLSGNVRSILHPQPSSVSFGLVSTPIKAPLRRAIEIHNFGKESVELRSATSDLPFVTAAVSAKTPGRLFRLELVLSPDAPKGEFEGKVKIESSSPVMPWIEVPFKGKVN